MAFLGSVASSRGPLRVGPGDAAEHKLLELHEKMAPYLRGRLAPTETPTEMDPDHHALSSQLRKQLASRGGATQPCSPNSS